MILFMKPLRRAAVLLAGILAFIASLVYVGRAETDVSSRPAAVGYFRYELTPGFHFLGAPLLVGTQELRDLFPKPPEGTIIYKFNSEQPFFPEEWELLEQILQTAPGEAPGLIRLERTSQAWRLHWLGELEIAPEVNGPYERHSALTSPFDLIPGQDNQFWRARRIVPRPALEGFTAYHFRDGFWSNPWETIELGEGFIWYNPTDSTIEALAGEVFQGERTVAVPKGFSLLAVPVPVPGRLSSDFGLHPTPGDWLLLQRDQRIEIFTYLGAGHWTPSEPRIELAEGFFLHAQEAFEWNLSFTVNP